MQGGDEAFRGPNGRRQVKGGGWGMSQRMQEIDGAEEERPEGVDKSSSWGDFAVSAELGRSRRRICVIFIIQLYNKISGPDGKLIHADDILKR